MTKTNIYLLIILSVLIYSCAAEQTCVKVKVNEFYSEKIKPTLTGLVEDGIEICSGGIRHYYRSENLFGGGGRTFMGYAIPCDLDTSKHGCFIMKKRDDSIKVVGFSKKLFKNQKPIYIELVAKPDESIKIKMVDKFKL